MRSTKPVALKNTRRRRTGGPTFIQRSRGESSEQKAIFHNVTGAGRSHVIRDFFRLSDDDKQLAHDVLQKALNERARQAR
jgi:hypothetical protein